MDFLAGLVNFLFEAGDFDGGFLGVAERLGGHAFGIFGRPAGLFGFLSGLLELLFGFARYSLGGGGGLSGFPGFVFKISRNLPLSCQGFFEGFEFHMIWFFSK